MLNQCTLIGRVASAPEERNAGQKTVLNFRMETWETNNGTQYKTYHTVNIWSDWVKKTARTFTEGQMIMVIGKYGTKKVEKNGSVAYYSSITAHTATPARMDGTSAEPKEESSNGGSYSSPPEGGGRGPVNTVNPYVASADNGEDIPF